MPIYTYVCRNCEAKVERLRPMDKMREPVKCLGCGGECAFRVAQTSRFQRSPGWKSRLHDMGATMPGEI